MIKSTIVRGALILTAANIITRILGFVYRIYMSNAIGVEGMGLYQLITPIYMLVWAVSSAGFSTSVSKLTAQEMARDKRGNTKRLLYIALIISIPIALLISIVVFNFSDYLAFYIIKDIRTSLSLKIISLCFPFMAAGSVIRGYFLGIKNTLIPGISQVMEQIVRMATVYILSFSLINKGLEYACGAAVAGMAIGEVISFIYTIIMYIIDNKGHYKKPTLRYFSALNMLLSMAIPLTLNRMSSSLFSTLESILIPLKLQEYGLNQGAALSLLGILNGMAMPLIMFPSSLLTALATATMPVISESNELNQHKRIQKTINHTMEITAIIAAFTTGVFFTFPGEIGYLIYGESNMNEILKMLALVCPFLYIQVTISGVLNGLGEQLFIFKVNIIMSIINIAVVYFVVPLWGINSFILSWILSSAIGTFMTTTRLKNTINLKLNIFKSFVVPALTAALSCLLGFWLKNNVELGSLKMDIVVVIVVVGGVYVGVLNLLRDRRR